MSQTNRGIDPHYLLAKPGGLNISSPVPLPSTTISHPSSPAGTSPRLAPRAQSHFDSRPISPRPGSLSLASFITATAEEHGETPYSRDPNAPPLIPPPRSPRFKDIFTTPRTEEEGMDSPWTRASKRMARARAAKKDLEGKDEEGDEDRGQFENVSYNFNGNREDKGAVGLGIGTGGGGEKDGLGFGGTTSGWENEGGARGWGGRNVKMLWCLAIIGLLGAALGISLGLTLRSRNAFRNAIEDQAGKYATPLTPVSSGFVLSATTTSRTPSSSTTSTTAYIIQIGSPPSSTTPSSSSPSPSFSSISSSSTSSTNASPTTFSSLSSSTTPSAPTRILAPSPTSPPSSGYTQTSYIYALSGLTTTVPISYTLPDPSLLQTRLNGQYQFTQQITLPSLGVGVRGSFVSQVRFRVMPVPTRVEGKLRMRGRRDGENRRERWRRVSIRSD